MTTVTVKCPNCGNHIIGDTRYRDTVCFSCGNTYDTRELLISQYGGDYAISDGVLTAYFGNDPNAVIPDGVIYIHDRAFEGADIKTVKIPSGVEKIGKLAFWGCKSLESVEFSEGLRIIGDGAFKQCCSLKAIDLPESVETIGTEAFFGCTSLEIIKVPAKDGCWDHPFIYGLCSSLLYVDIPEGITKLGYFLFAGCKSLQSAVIPTGIRSPSKGIFDGCSSLENVIIPDDVKQLHDFQFNFNDTPVFEKICMEKEVCRHCGGEFIEPYKKVCSKCKRRKDY